MKNVRKILTVLLLLAMTAGLVWAGAELLGQANKSAADAGSNAADLEMASLDMIKPSTNAPNVNWNQLSKIRKQMDANTAQYKKLAASVQGDSVSPQTKEKGMKLAKDFQVLCEKEAKLWDQAKNCPTRAKLAREAGVTRVANAEMTFSGADQDKIDAYNKQMEKMQDARSSYVSDAKGDLSEQDRADLQQTLLPKAQNLLSSVTGLSTQVAALLSDVTSQAGGALSGDPMAIAGCARQVAGSSSSDNPAAALLYPVKALYGMVTSLLSNIESLISDIMSLS